MDIDTQALRIAAANPPGPPPGKPWEELTHEQRARLDEIEADMCLLYAEWQRIVSDTYPVVPGLVPAED